MGLKILPVTVANNRFSAGHSLNPFPSRSRGEGDTFAEARRRTGNVLLGIGGAAVGAKVGDSSEHRLDTGVPRDDLELYRELLKQGRSLVIVEAASDEQVSVIRDILDRNGSEDVNAARTQRRRVA